MSKRTNHLAELVSRPTFFTLMLDHQLHGPVVLFECPHCRQFVDDHEEDLNYEVADIERDQLIAIITDPIVTATLEQHAKRKLQEQIAAEQTRADNAEEEIKQLRFDQAFCDDEDMITKTTH